MISKNNKGELFHKQANQAKRYTLKKLSVGVASVAIGVIVFLSHSQSVSADELISSKIVNTSDNGKHMESGNSISEVSESFEEKNLGDYYVGSEDEANTTAEEFEKSEILGKLVEPKQYSNSGLTVEEEPALTAPTLTQTGVENNELTRTVHLPYTLNNPMHLETRGTAHVKKAGTTVKLENAKVQDYREATIKYITFGTDPDLKQEQINYYVNAINSVTSDINFQAKIDEILNLRQAEKLLEKAKKSETFREKRLEDIQFLLKGVTNDSVQDKKDAIFEELNKLERKQNPLPSDNKENKPEDSFGSTREEISKELAQLTTKFNNLEVDTSGKRIATDEYTTLYNHVDKLLAKWEELASIEVEKSTARGTRDILKNFTADGIASHKLEDTFESKREEVSKGLAQLTIKFNNLEVDSSGKRITTDEYKALYNRVDKLLAKWEELASTEAGKSTARGTRDLLKNYTADGTTKKIELKSIEGTTLVKREANGELIELSQLREAPEDVSNYFIKAKMTHLKDVVMPVESIKEVTIDGQNVYEVTARAAELVHKVDGAYKEGTVLYMNKYQAPHGEVYYDFGDLIKAMQANLGGTFQLGRTISAGEVAKLGHKSYVSGQFTGQLIGTRNGKRYSITDLKHPLFERINGGRVQDIDFKDIHIVYPDSGYGDNIATVAHELKNRGVIENVNITGYIEGRDNVSGFVNYVNSRSRIENVSFQGRIKSVGGNSVSGGIAGENREALVTRAYVDAHMDMHRSNDSSLLVGIVISNPNGSSAKTWGKVSHSVVKGHIRANIRKKLAAIATSAWGYGNVEEIVSYATVQNGYELFGSDGQLADGSPQYQLIRKLYGVQGVSSGTIQGEDKRFERLSTEEANKKIADYNITAMSLLSQGTPAEELNRRDSYEGAQGYKAQHAGLYQLVEKLQPFYNREWIVKEANQLVQSNKVPSWVGTKTVQAIVPMKDKQFVMDSGEMNRVMLHFTDGTKVEYSLSKGRSFGETGIREYTIDELGVRYTPNRLVTQYDDIVNSLSDELKQVELYTPDMYQLLKINEDTDQKKADRVKRLFLDEVFAQTKRDLPQIMNKLIQNEGVMLAKSEAVVNAIRDKVSTHSKQIMMALTYLNRYYGINFGDYNVKDLMMFMPEFYSGQGGSLIDRLIKLGSSSEHHLSGQRTHEFFNRHFSQGVGGNLFQFLNYNRKLLTNFSQMNDWFADATKDTIRLVERQSLLKEIQDKQAKYRAYDNLSHSYYHKMILPLLNLREAKMFLISTYSTLTFGSEAKRNLSTEQLIKEINKSGDRKRDFLDAWYTLANKETKNRLIKDRVTPTWEGFGVHGRGWINQFGYDNKGRAYAPAREFYNVVGQYYGNNGVGAYANGTLINFVAYDYLGEGGHSVWTHEMTHNYDGAVFLGGPGRRSGVGAEAYAQGMLQVPAKSAGYGSLGINLTFSRPQDGNQIYNNDPKRFKSQEMFDRYMRGYNDALMMLDYLEGEAAIKQGQPTMKHWFKKMDKNLRKNGQIDRVRQLTDKDWSALKIKTVDDLVDQQLMTRHGLGDGTYDMSNGWSTYVTIDYLGGIYGGGDNSVGAPGAAMFKHNTFRIWGYYGYERGFVGYASNKYKGASREAGHAELSDNFAMQQISNSEHQSIESFKKAYFAEVMNNLKTQGMIDIEIDGVQYSSYESLAEKFTQTVQADVKAKNHNRTRAFKDKLFKALLYKTDNFQSSIFKK